MTLDNGTDRQTDGRTDRVRRNMRPPPREEGRIIMQQKKLLIYSLDEGLFIYKSMHIHKLSIQSQLMA